MKVAYLFPEELPMRAARGIQAVNTVWALAKKTDVFFVPASFSEEVRSFYGLTEPGPEIKPFSRRLGPLKSQLFSVFRSLPLIRTCDIVFTRHVKAAWWLIKLRSLHQKPIIYEAHEIFAEKGFREPIEEKVYQRSSGLIFISEGLKKAVERKYKPPFSLLKEVIPSGTRKISVNWEKFASPVTEIIYLGTFRYPWKGETVLLAALSYFPKGVKLKIYGDPPQKSHKKILYGGYVVPGEVSRFLAEAQVAVFPLSSRQEIARHYTSPLKLLDYMAAGCAIVASDLPSVREIVSPKEALLVPPDNPQALAEGVKRLLSDRNLRLSLAQAAYQRVKRFTWERRAEKISRFFKKIYNENNG